MQVTAVIIKKIIVVREYIDGEISVGTDICRFRRKSLQTWRPKINGGVVVVCNICCKRLSIKYQFSVHSLARFTKGAARPLSHRRRRRRRAAQGRGRPRLLLYREVPSGTSAAPYGSSGL